MSKHFFCPIFEEMLPWFKVPRLRPIVVLITALLRLIGWNDKMILTCEKQVSVPLCPLRIFIVLARDQTHAFAIRGRYVK